MIYLVLYRYRDLLGKWRDEVHPVVYKSEAEALAALPTVSDKKQSMGWVAEIPTPDFKPQFKLVADDPETLEIQAPLILTFPHGAN